MKFSFVLPNQQVVSADLPEQSPFIDFLLSTECPPPLKGVLALKVDGKPYDIRLPLPSTPSIEVITPETDEGLEILRHSTSHLMAQAVTELYPGTKVTIGPAIENGFFYDFLFPQPITDKDLPKIEKRMKKIIERAQPFKRMEMPRSEAIDFFKKQDEHFKVEILQGLTEERVSLYEQGTFIDLCTGPHLPTARSIKAFKLLSVAGAYWRGDENREQLTRIYGTTFPTQAALEAHLARLAEADKRDHRKLGKMLDLYSTHEELGPGFIYWHPKGARIRHIIETFWREEHYKAGYDLVYTPHLAKNILWETSGHTNFYQENMFPTMEVDKQHYRVKPMNCPFHIQIYKTHLRSYRELPLRWAELGTVYRYERSGVMHGLMRVRGFTQDDAHLFCRPDQLMAEISQVLVFTRFMLSTFGFDTYEVFLSTRPEKFVGSEAHWEEATRALAAALKTEGFAYAIDPGEGVFYGPKIDIKIKDVLGRSWQCATIQVDFNLPERFHLTYRGADGADHQPIMIHRALFGSLERFFGILIEHYGGDFPLWLAPVQVALLPIADRHVPYAESIQKTLAASAMRVTLDARREKIGHKIREAELQKIPYMMILGDQEIETHTLAVRARKEGDMGKVTVADFIEKCRPSLEIQQGKQV